MLKFKNLIWVILYTLLLNYSLYSLFGQLQKQDQKLFMGFGVGPEMGISLMLPKLSFNQFYEEKNFEFFHATETTINLVGTFTLAANMSLGIKKKIFTIENSLGFWWYPKTTNSVNDQIGPFFHLSNNPKLGFKFWRLWLKAGPSFVFYKDYNTFGVQPGLIGLTKFGKLQYNFEILIRMSD